MNLSRCTKEIHDNNSQVHYKQTQLRFICHNAFFTLSDLLNYLQLVSREGERLETVDHFVTTRLSFNAESSGRLVYASRNSGPSTSKSRSSRITPCTQINTIIEQQQLIRVKSFFTQRVINVWNNLPMSVEFGSLSAFTKSIGRVNLNQFLTVYKFSLAC